MTDALKELNKVNSRHVYMLWRNFALALITLFCTVLLTRLLPPIFAPIISTIACAILYVTIYNNAFSDSESCIVVPYMMFIVILAYTILTVLLNLLNIWGIVDIPSAMVFFDGYFVPGLILGPCGVIVGIIIYIRRHRLSICSECRLSNGAPIERGQTGLIFSRESTSQIKNLIAVFTIISCLCWGYYFFLFSDVSLTSRDIFVFSWTALVVYLVDVLIFGMRYYNLYLDLKENDEIVSPAELENISARTYLRFYVICGDSIYLYKRESMELRDEFRTVLDTPFFTRKMVSGIPEREVKTMIEEATGIKGGKLKFFFGRRVSDSGKHRMLRYFYFLPESLEECPAQLKRNGEWLSSERFKTIYNTRPLYLSSTLLSDMTRLATILITSKTFDENGERRTRLMQYRPSFNFSELRNSDIDFHGDLWLRVANNNADHRFFRFKKIFSRRKPTDNYPFDRTPLY